MTRVQISLITGGVPEFPGKKPSYGLRQLRRNSEAIPALQLLTTKNDDENVDDDGDNFDA